MKKLTALALLGIFLFNIGGYSVLFWAEKQQASKELRSHLDRDEFAGSEAITLKVPLSIPYQSDHDYQRVDGDFEYHGQFYKLVKQRVLGDTLYVVCIIDNKKKELVDEMNEFTRKASEDQPVKLSTNIQLQDYSSESIVELTSSSSGWTISYSFFEIHSLLTESSLDTKSPPPWC